MPNRKYLDYLESPEWWTLRKTAMRRAQFRCERERPGEARHEGPLEIHHLHYRTLGNERLEDLQVLCPACHEQKRLPKNLRKQALEAYGQSRLFDRWDDDDANIPLEAA